MGAGDTPVFEDLVHAGRAQRIELQGRGLVVGGDARVADECHRRILRLLFATPKPLSRLGGRSVAKRILFAIEH